MQHRGKVREPQLERDDQPAAHDRHAQSGRDEGVDPVHVGPDHERTAFQPRWSHPTLAQVPDPA
jgi:hypothetical protein